MKRTTIYAISLIVLTICLFCKKNGIEPDNNGTEPVVPIEPEMIFINKDLTFTYLESSFSIHIDTQMVVSLEPYYIGKYELSNIEYFQFVKDSGYTNSKWWSERGWYYKNEENWKMPKYWGYSEPPYTEDVQSNMDDTPVRNISFYEAEAYCNWISEKTGKKYKVPSSAEWVRAAKGPDPGRKYPWGNDWIENRARYIFWDDSLFVPVNSYPEGISFDGCYNMIGNVFEITVPIFLHYQDTIDNFRKMIFSYPDFNDTPSSFTTYSYIGFHDYDRMWSLGVRLCREK
jgi:formylglycine-generating enzyme required for sulfatase activity